MQPYIMCPSAWVATKPLWGWPEQHIVFMIAYILRSSCFCEIWALCASWITYDHLCIWIYVLYILYIYYIYIYIYISYIWYIYICIYIWTCRSLGPCMCCLSLFVCGISNQSPSRKTHYVSYLSKVDNLLQ